MSIENRKVVVAATTTTRTTQTRSRFSNSVDMADSTRTAPKAPARGHLARLSEDFQRIIQKTVRRYQVCSDVLSAFCMLSMILTAGFIDPQPQIAMLTAFAGLLAATALKCADCSTTDAPSRTVSGRNPRVITSGTASQGHWTEHRSSRSNGIISGGERR